jgi:DNA polymerase
VKILLCGEAWGEREARFSHPFVGASGAELGRMLAQTNLAPEIHTKYPSELDMIMHWKKLRERHGIDTANVFNLHPQGNNIDLFFTSAKEGMANLPPLRPGKYLKPEFMPQVENLWRKVEDEKPNLVLALGNTACWAILGESKISTIRGTVKTSPKLGVKTLPTYHPAAVLRQWNLRTVVLSDFEKAKREAEFREIRRVERFVTVEPTLSEISEWIERPADFYAVDIETYGKLISMIGFARSPSDALVIPFMDESKDTWSHWSSVEDEVEAWKFADKLLRKPIPKVFQNGVFDLSYLLRAGLRPAMCNGDTMLLHHSLYPEMLKGLGFLGSIYANEQAWKPMRKKGNNLKRDE